MTYKITQLLHNLLINFKTWDTEENIKSITKGNLTMKSFERFSLMMLVAPMLFVGCVSEKITSITPVSDKNVTLENNTTIESNLTVSEVHLRDEYKELASTSEETFTPVESRDTIESKPKLTFKYSWEELTNGYKKSISTTMDEQLTTQKLSFDDTWEELTKEDEILETAKNFLGVKYVWAANGPSAFDCSGFTKYVFKQNGINLPRYSGNQANIGEKIAFSELQKGDLVFFDTEKKFRHKVNHVGIYIGDNKFIHASSAKKRVTITSFAKKKFYRNKFLYARRVINTNENVALNTTQNESLFN